MHTQADGCWERGSNRVPRATRVRRGVVSLALGLLASCSGVAEFTGQVVKGSGSKSKPVEAALVRLLDRAGAKPDLHVVEITALGFSQSLLRVRLGDRMRLVHQRRWNEASTTPRIFAGPTVSWSYSGEAKLRRVGHRYDSYGDAVDWLGLGLLGGGIRPLRGRLSGLLNFGETFTRTVRENGVFVLSSAGRAGVSVDDASRAADAGKASAQRGRSTLSIRIREIARTRSRRDGSFALPALPPGDYELRASHRDFGLAKLHYSGHARGRSASEAAIRLRLRK